MKKIDISTPKYPNHFTMVEFDDIKKAHEARMEAERGVFLWHGA